MLVTFFLYLLISTVCLWTGILIYSIPWIKEDRQRPLLYYFITGLIGLTALGQWIVLFFPLNLFIFCLTILAIVAITLLSRNVVTRQIRQFYHDRKKADLWLLISGGSLLVMILTLNAGQTIMDDTDSYHLQMVKWARDFGSVPGIANLHLRFGLNSSWFVSIAMLLPRISDANGYLILNGLLSAWIALYLLGHILGGIKQPGKNLSISVLALLVLALVNWPMIRGNACSTNYDFISTCVILALFIEKENDKIPESSFEWVIWPVYLCTVRLLNFPLLLLSLFSLIMTGRKQRLFMVTAAVIIGLPMLIRNLILSGYLFFPVYQVDLFAVDWKADKAQISEMLTYIRYFNRVNPMFEPMTKTMTLGFPEWIRAWYKNLFRFDQWLVTISFISYGFIFLRWNKFLGKAKRIHKIFLITMISQLILWFFVAPDPRFVYGPLLFGIFLMLSKIDFSRVISVFNISKTGVIFLSILVLGYAAHKIVKESNYRNWIEPRPLPVPPVRNVSVDGLELHIPEKILDNWNPRCYDIALPCLYKLDPRLEARGKTLKQGFRISKTKYPKQVEGEYKITE